jgi:hypothetical protein
MLAATGLASKSADPAAAPSAAVTAPAAAHEARKSATPQAGKCCRAARTSVIKSRVDQAVPKVGARMTVTPHILAPLHAAQAQSRPVRGPGFWCCTGLVLLSTLAAASPALAAPTSPPTAAQQKQRLQSHRQAKLPPLRQQGSTPAVAKGTLLPPQLSPPASPSAPTAAPDCPRLLPRLPQLLRLPRRPGRLPRLLRVLRPQLPRPLRLHRSQQVLPPASCSLCWKGTPKARS